MKCHKILGIRESSTENDIEKAFADRQSELALGSETLSPASMEKKAEELMSAKAECITWLSMTNAEKRSARLHEAKDTLTDQSTMYSSPIGCCSACAYACCDSDSTGNHCCDGCGCTSFAGYIDIGIYILLGIGAVVGLFSLLPKITRSIRESNEKARQQRVQAAIEENKQLRWDLSEAEKRQNSANERVTAVTQQCTSTIAFCHLFERMGCNSCAEIVFVEQKRVEAAKMNKGQEDENVNRIQERIHKNDMIITGG